MVVRVPYSNQKQLNLGSLIWISFYINLPVGAISTIFILLFFVNEPPKNRPGWASMLRQLDLMGLTLVVGAVVCFILALQWGGISKAWSSGAVIGTLVVFVICVALFILAQWWQGENAMVHTPTLKRRTIAVASLFSFLYVSQCGHCGYVIDADQR
jgi:uncharacterized membrane protein YbhN (UPF0104 family)